uniref:RBD domain-containing protein n=1 Tax=Plectus sambesii TaxID=2011161 RepID=A0A914WUC3_9BILA
MSSQNDLVSLTISLPDDRQVEMDVDSETPMMDLLVQIACKYGLSPSGVALRVPSERSSGYIRYQPSTPVGRLDSCRIEIVDRAQLANRPSRPSHRRPSGLPFEPTQRIQIDLGRYQKTFVRISTAATVAELVDEVCKQQILNRRRYRIRAAAAPHVALDEKLPIREVGTTVFTLVPIDGFDKRAESTDVILGEIEKMPAEEKEKKKKKGFFSIFKSSKSSKSKSPPNHEAKGVAANGAVNAEVSRSRQVPEVVITDERRRGESNLSQASSRKKRAAPQPPEPATVTVTTVGEVASDRQSRRNSDSSSGYHESCASPTEDCSSSLEKRPIDVTLAGKKKTRAPSPPPAATTHQGERCLFSTGRTAVGHWRDAAQTVLTTRVSAASTLQCPSYERRVQNSLPSRRQNRADIRRPLVVGRLIRSSRRRSSPITPARTAKVGARTPTPEREPAEPAKIAASPPPPSPTPSVEPQPQSVLSAPLAEVLSESLAQTTTSPAVADSIPRESKPVIAISSPPPAPPPPPTLILPKADKLESNISTVTLRTSPVLQRPQQLSVEMPSPTDLSSQIAREAAETLHKLSPIGQRRFFPTAQRHSNITLNERQKDSPPAIRVASFEEEYAVKQYEHRLNSPLGNESDAFASVSLNNSISSAAEDASEERLQKEYDALRAMFDEWQVLSGRLEMRGTADPSISNRLRQLQRELAQQHQTVQRLCAVVQTDAARATKNVRIDSGTERSGSSQSSFGTANSSHHSPSPPPALVPELPKSIAHTNQSNDKFFVKETTEVLSASKQPTGGSSAYEPKMHLDNGSSHPVNTPLRPKTASAPQKRPISVHGTAFAMKNVTTANGHDLGHAFRQCFRYRLLLQSLSKSLSISQLDESSLSA